MSDRDVDNWAIRANALLKWKFCIDFNDAGFDREDIRRFYARGDTPAEFVEWYGERYDLTPLGELLSPLARARTAR